MGIVYTRPPESMTLGTAVIRTPFSDITAPVGFHDGDDKCFPFQLRWIDCCEAYGREMAKEKCKYLYQDFIECSRCWKQRARLGDMMERRYQLWLQGVAGTGPKRPLFHETPRYDGFVPYSMYVDMHTLV
ncbi:NADH dehydrogenase [ubiquinone] iron-sulfur protein 5 [Orchesella cincta]|uniref:NADH dehydrogenase [ubiquinone] iron-sulfur protein 5 n=1 Tax=Orchesella cincta TaxID=48709 RepID=A0A1D2NJ46_ORCCI|nr:NADH dehydrogenase [ubiquinone] iron-sulfur protein 5 [Orchesella cincta]